MSAQFNWKLLSSLREEFLAEKKNSASYWSEEALAEYDRSFGRRILWKWESVLKEVQAKGWVPPEGSWTLVDWGCGTAVASEAFLSHFPPPSKVLLHDRSSQAVEYSRAKLSKLFPEIEPKFKMEPLENLTGPIVFLISHVLNELQKRELKSLLATLSSCSSIFWVEPGTYEISRMLIEAREEIRKEFHLLAPCPHQQKCGLLAKENEKHWCHHFAEVPAQVFRSSEWATFSRQMKIDLHKLPVSYLIADKRLFPSVAGASRLIGHARLSKGEGKFLLCSESGVKDTQLMRKNESAFFDECEKRPFSVTRHSE
jgi:ribosomal protein RSM22 (predicted rRNA methylase)